MRLMAQPMQDEKNRDRGIDIIAIVKDDVSILHCTSSCGFGRCSFLSGNRDHSSWKWYDNRSYVKESARFFSPRETRNESRERSRAESRAPAFKNHDSSVLHRVPLGPNLQRGYLSSSVRSTACLDRKITVDAINNAANYRTSSRLAKFDGFNGCQLRNISGGQRILVCMIEMLVKAWLLLS